MFFTTTVVLSVSTTADESSDVSSTAAMDDLSNDQYSIQVDYSKTNKNDRSPVQDPIKKWNTNNNTQIIITEDIAASVLLELQSLWVLPQS